MDQPHLLPPEPLLPAAEPDPAWIVWLAALAAAVAVGWLALGPVADTDIWWQLATGREALATGSTLPVDTFSFTYAGQPWLYKDLGAAVAWWLAWSAGGAAGIVLLKATLVSATAVVLAATLRCRGASGLYTAAGIAVFAAASAIRIAERSEWWSWLALASGLYLTERARDNLRWLWGFVPLTLVAANLHRGAVLLPALVTIAALGLGFSRPGRRLELAGVVVLTSLALLANPFGTVLVTSAFGVVGVEVYRELLGEWTPPTLPLLGEVAPWLVIVAGLAAPAVAICWRQPGMPDAVLAVWWLVAVALASRSLRFLPVLALVSVLLAVPWLQRALQRAVTKAGLALPLIVVVLLAHLTVQGPWPAPLLGLEPGRYAVGATEFARKHQLAGPVLHDFDDGGWLLWNLPQAKVLIDGRNDQLYPPKFFAETLLQTLEIDVGMQRAAQRWQVDWLWLRPRLDDPSRAFAELDARWALVFVSEKAMILVRRDGKFGHLAANAYQVLLPHRFSAQMQQLAGGKLPQPEQFVRDLKRLRQDDPRWVVAYEAERWLRAKGLWQPGPAQLPGMP